MGQYQSNLVQHRIPWTRFEPYVEQFVQVVDTESSHPVEREWSRTRWLHNSDTLFTRCCLPTTASTAVRHSVCRYLMRRCLVDHWTYVCQYQDADVKSDAVIAEKHLNVDQLWSAFCAALGGHDVTRGVWYYWIQGHDLLSFSGLQNENDSWTVQARQWFEQDVQLLHTHVVQLCDLSVATLHLATIPSSFWERYRNDASALSLYLCIDFHPLARALILARWSCPVVGVPDDYWSVVDKLTTNSTVRNWTWFNLCDHLLSTHRVFGSHQVGLFAFLRPHVFVHAYNSLDAVDKEQQHIHSTRLSARVNHLVTNEPELARWWEWTVACSVEPTHMRLAMNQLEWTHNCDTKHWQTQALEHVKRIALVSNLSLNDCIDCHFALPHQKEAICRTQAYRQLAIVWNAAQRYWCKIESIRIRFRWRLYVAPESLNLWNTDLIAARPIQWLSSIRAHLTRHTLELSSNTGLLEILGHLLSPGSVYVDGIQLALICKVIDEAKRPTFKFVLSQTENWTGAVCRLHQKINGLQPLMPRLCFSQLPDDATALKWLELWSLCAQRQATSRFYASAKINHPFDVWIQKHNQDKAIEFCTWLHCQPHLSPTSADVAPIFKTIFGAGWTDHWTEPKKHDKVASPRRPRDQNHVEARLFRQRKSVHPGVKLLPAQAANMTISSTVPMSSMLSNEPKVPNDFKLLAEPPLLMDSNRLKDAKLSDFLDGGHSSEEEEPDAHSDALLLEYAIGSQLDSLQLVDYSNPTSRSTSTIASALQSPTLVNSTTTTTSFADTLPLQILETNKTLVLHD